MPLLHLTQASLRMIYIIAMSNFVVFLAWSKLPDRILHESLRTQSRISFDWHVENERVSQAGDHIDPLPWDEQYYDSLQQYAWWIYIAMFIFHCVFFILPHAVYYFCAALAVVLFVMLVPFRSRRWLLFAPLVVPVAALITFLLFGVIPAAFVGDSTFYTDPANSRWLTPVGFDRAAFAAKIALYSMVIVHAVFALSSLVLSWCVSFGTEIEEKLQAERYRGHIGK